MANAIGMRQPWMRRTLASLIFAIVLNGCRVFCTTVTNHNQVTEHLKLLSQTNDNGLQPSRLRTLLVNDLRNILIKSVRI